MLGSFNLSIRSIISKLKQKYEVDNSQSVGSESPHYVKLLYLKDLNDDFIDLQRHFEIFVEKYFSQK
jgi:hypothetical protein